MLAIDLVAEYICSVIHGDSVPITAASFHVSVVNERRVGNNYCAHYLFCSPISLLISRYFNFFLSHFGSFFFKAL